MLGNAPKINGDDVIEIANGTTTNEVPESATWTELKLCVNKVPNFFPAREKEEYRVLDRTQALSIQGERPTIDGTLDVYLNTSFAGAYVKMIASQNDETQGNCFWFKIYKKSEARTIYCRCTIDDVLPNSTEESGGLDIYSLNLTNVDEAIQVSDTYYVLTEDEEPVEGKTYYTLNSSGEYVEFSGSTFVDGTDYYEKKTYWK